MSKLVYAILLNTHFKKYMNAPKDSFLKLSNGRFGTHNASNERDENQMNIKTK